MLEELNPPTIDVAKIDVEGFECQVFAGGQTLFTRYRPRFLLAETKDPVVARCVREIAARHGYRMSRPQGQDQNVVLYAPTSHDT